MVSPTRSPEKVTGDIVQENTELECPICYTPASEMNAVLLNTGCGHTFCSDCLRNYAAEQPKYAVVPSKTHIPPFALDPISVSYRPRTNFTNNFVGYRLMPPTPKVVAGQGDMCCAVYVQTDAIKSAVHVWPFAGLSPGSVLCSNLKRSERLLSNPCRGARRSTGGSGRQFWNSQSMS